MDQNFGKRFKNPLVVTDEYFQELGQAIQLYNESETFEDYFINAIFSKEEIGISTLPTVQEFQKAGLTSKFWKLMNEFDFIKKRIEALACHKSQYSEVSSQELTDFFNKQPDGSYFERFRYVKTD